MDKLLHDITDILSTGGWAGTRYIHRELFRRGHTKLSRKHLLRMLNACAEPGEYVSIGGIRQKSWIMDNKEPIN